MQARASSSLLRLLAAVALAGMCSLPAQAALGGDVNSIEADRAHMNAAVEVTHGAAYDVHAIQSTTGDVVDEYTSADGKVFAVAWHGPFMPEMQQILGAYYQQYSAALQARERRYGHQPLNIQLPGFVLQTGGHVRAYFGRAYIPGMLPQGVAADAIR